jgi:hypothetical protein
VFQWVAKILERGELSQLACCRACRRFFIPKVPWQKDCGEKCKIFHDNRLSARRKATQKEHKKKKKAAEQRRAKQANEKKGTVSSYWITGLYKVFRWWSKPKICRTGEFEQTVECIPDGCRLYPSM